MLAAGEFWVSPKYLDGQPQCGQKPALVDISLLQSGQCVRAIKKTLQKHNNSYPIIIEIPE